jgi:hypothetical protein
VKVSDEVILKLFISKRVWRPNNWIGSPGKSTRSGGSAERESRTVTTISTGWPT